MKTRLIVFLRAARPGHVKTRLAEAIVAAGRPWLKSLSPIYDALLDRRYELPKKYRRWLEARAAAYRQRVEASERGEISWPVLRAKPVDLARWDWE